MPWTYADLKVLDVSDPQNIRALQGYDTAGDVLGVDVLGDRVALGAGVMGLVLLERTPGGVMARIGNAPSSDAARRVRIRDNLAYVACRKSGLRIISLETPGKPVELGNVDTLSDAVDIWVEDKLAYVATYGTGLQIFDVSTPSSPVAVGAFPGTGLTLSVRVAGGKAYVASEDLGVVILDVTNPAKVFKLGEFNTGVAGDNSLCLEKDGDIVVTAGNQRLSVLDVSQP